MQALILPESLTMVMGAQQTLAVTMEPSAASATLRYHVADPAIAAVTDGTLYALSRGETTVTVQAHNGVSATLRLTVTGVPAQSVTLTDPTQELARGNSLQLSAAVAPAWAEDIPLTWHSSDEAIATVDANGVVTAHSAGTVAIRATANSGRYDEVTLTTFHAVEALTWADDTLPEDALVSLNMVDCTTYQLAVTCLPADHTYPDLTYTTSNAKVATVDANGLITAKGLGEAEITISAQRTHVEGVTLTCRIQVLPYDLSTLALPDAPNLTYNGAAQQPAPVLELNSTALRLGTDYTIATDNALHAGEHPYTVQGCGIYTGEVTGTFTILRADAGLTYTGRQVYELSDFAPAYTSAGLTEITVHYTLPNDPDTLLTEAPPPPETTGW